MSGLYYYHYIGRRHTKDEFVPRDDFRATIQMYTTSHLRFFSGNRKNDHGKRASYSHIFSLKALALCDVYL